MDVNFQPYQASDLSSMLILFARVEEILLWILKDEWTFFVKLKVKMVSAMYIIVYSKTFIFLFFTMFCKDLNFRTYVDRFEII